MVLYTDKRNAIVLHHIPVHQVLAACGTMNLPSTNRYPRPALSPLTLAPLQIEYSRQKMDIDARQLKALVSGLRPNSTYEFRVTCMERSDGGTRHRVVARTAPLVLDKKPRLEIDVDPDSALTISFPPVESKDIK